MKQRTMQPGLIYAVLAGIACTANASTTILSCQTPDGSPFVMKLDMDNKTMVGDHKFGWDPDGPTAIQVTDEEIRWVVEGDSVNTLSRINGSLQSTGTGTSTGGHWTAQCHKGEQQF